MVTLSLLPLLLAQVVVLLLSAEGLGSLGGSLEHLFVVFRLLPLARRHLPTAADRARISPNRDYGRNIGVARGSQEYFRNVRMRELT